MVDAFDDSFVLRAGTGPLSVRISPHGGSILEAHWRETPVLRPYAGDRGAPFQILKAASFPLLPFGNRLEGNAFAFEGRRHELLPNLEWDTHYLHGDGWLGEWTVLDRAAASARLAFEFRADGATPYVYGATQSFVVTDDTLDITLGVTNRGDHALPFGIGHHPFFPMNEVTRLKARATAYWTEKAGWLPDQRKPLPPHLDFSQGGTLPRHYVNNGLEGWNGTARIDWPDRGLSLTMTAEPLFDRAFLFVSDEVFDPSFKKDYFCFEPMSHTAGGHLLDDLGGLRILAPGETLTGSVRFEIASSS